mmetsp:Transcript_44031/g.86103  ORF Transcript_44031/g.86103 Transcript_44031/m.86103 type:complete len:129 (+) Transcript_44031:9-395(+)
MLRRGIGGFRRWFSSVTPDKQAMTMADLMAGRTLDEASEILSLSFRPEARWKDAASRKASLMELRNVYCAKMLEQCNICENTMAKLVDPSYLPSRTEVLEAFQLDIPSPEVMAAASRSTKQHRNNQQT